MKNQTPIVLLQGMRIIDFLHIFESGPIAKVIAKSIKLVSPNALQILCVGTFEWRDFVKKKRSVEKIPTMKFCFIILIIYF